MKTELESLQKLLISMQPPPQSIEDAPILTQDAAIAVAQEAIRPFFNWAVEDNAQFFVQAPTKRAAAFDPIGTIAHELGHFFSVPPIKGSRHKFRKTKSPQLIEIFRQSNLTVDALVHHISKLPNEKQVETEMIARAVCWLIYKKLGRNDIYVWEQGQKLFGTLYSWDRVEPYTKQPLARTIADLVMKVLAQHKLIKKEQGVWRQNYSLLGF